MMGLSHIIAPVTWACGGPRGREQSLPFCWEHVHPRGIPGRPPLACLTQGAFRTLTAHAWVCPLCGSWEVGDVLLARAKGVCVAGVACGEAVPGPDLGLWYRVVG